MSIPPEILGLIPADIAHDLRVLPLRQEDGRLVICVENPADVEAMEQIRLTVDRELMPIRVPATELTFALWRFYGPRRKSARKELS